MKTYSVYFILLATAAEAQEPAPPQQPRARNEFNPAITVFHDMLWRLDNKDVVEIEDGETIVKDDKFLLRETEVDFRASIDPYADGVLIIALEQEAPGEFHVDVEEAYLRIKSLPFGFWEEPPLATKIRIGRFLPAIGRQNRLHTHDLPQPQRGLAYETFAGDHPYIANGASAEMLLPLNLTLVAEAVQGGGWDFGEGGTDRPAYVANLSWFDSFGDEHDVEIGLIGYYGHNDVERRRHVRYYGLDFLYKWKPVRQGEWRSLVVAGQLCYGSQEFLVDVDGDGDNAREPGVDLDGDGNIDERLEDRRRAFSWFAYAQYQIDRRWYVGLRYDWTQYLEDSAPGKDDEASRVTPYVSLYLSEFFRFRVAYEFTKSDVHEDDDLHTLLVEFTAVFGSHPPHPYWVNQ
jgi:hypothetical protein